MKRLIIIFCMTFLILDGIQGQDTLKIHFIYGSKPIKKYSDTEIKWFGGIHGGHVGIEVDSSIVLSFISTGKAHIFSNKKRKYSKYVLNTENTFYSIFRGNTDSVKYSIFYIPIMETERNILDSISEIYLKDTPYDYAFFGMRCASATYDILSEMDVLRKYNRLKTCSKAFYPKKLRKRLFNKAKENGWRVDKHNGSITRKWEKD